MTRAELIRAISEISAMAVEAERDPARWMSWLPGQAEFLKCTDKAKLFRAGNQSLGKTTAGLSEIHFRCLGEHPFQEVPNPPIEAWVLCASWSQSLAIQAKFFAISQSYLVEGSRFDQVNGFHANRPTARYRNGSIVRFKTTKQSGLDLAGATIDVALFDEPPASSRIFEEVRKRLIRGAGGGQLLLCLTPINAPTDWLKELCEAEPPQVTDVHRRLTAEELIPIGEEEPLKLPSGQPMDQAWIDELRRTTLPFAEPVVVDGEWEQRVQGRVFASWDETAMLRATAPDAPEWKVCLGIDHGSKVGKEVALLVLVDESGDHDRVWVADEYVGVENGTISDDARGILGMLSRNGIRWSQLDYAWGDRLYIRGALDRKSNSDLIREIAKLLSIPSKGLLPSIRTVKRGTGRGRGSVDAGCRYLHQAMLRPGHFYVHPRCNRLTTSLDRWDYSDNDEKDPIDALRYALQYYVFRTSRGRQQMKRLFLY